MCIGDFLKCIVRAKDPPQPQKRVLEVSNGCGAQNGRRSRFSATNAAIRKHADDREIRSVGLLTRALRFWDQRTSLRLPRGIPSDWLSPKKQGIGTYSGGTVRESHPVILFSIPGSSPEMPRNFFSVV